MEENIISEPQGPVIPMSVGEEFVAWAETYWGLREQYKESTDSQSGERGVYKYMRETWINRIDKMIENKLRLSGVLKSNTYGR